MTQAPHHRHGSLTQLLNAKGGGIWAAKKAALSNPTRHNGPKPSINYVVTECLSPVMPSKQALSSSWRVQNLSSLSAMRKQLRVDLTHTSHTSLKCSRREVTVNQGLVHEAGYNLFLLFGSLL